MSTPRDPGRDLRLERLGERDDPRRAHLGEAAHVGAPVAGVRGAGQLSLAYRSLIDAVFTAPGAAEWLRGLRRMVAALVAEDGPAPRDPVACDSIRAAGPRPGRP